MPVNPNYSLQNLLRKILSLSEIMESGISMKTYKLFSYHSLHERVYGAHKVSIFDESIPYNQDDIDTLRLSETLVSMKSIKLWPYQRRQHNWLNKSRIQHGIFVYFAHIALSHMSLHIFFHCWPIEYLLNSLNSHEKPRVTPVLPLKSS